MSEKLLDNKTILISGGSGGIGSACALEAAQEGAHVCLIGRNKDSLQKALSDLPAGNHKSCILDLHKEEDIKKIIADTINESGKIDGFIHAAGYEITKPLRKTTMDDFLSLFTINTVSAFSIIRELLKQKASPLSFVLISSIMGTLGERGKIAYCASKGGLLSSVKALALEIAPKKHRVNTISPAMVKTPLVSAMLADFPPDMIAEIKNRHPLGFGLPQDIANLAVFLLSDKARWITGTDFVIDGGYSAI